MLRRERLTGKVRYSQRQSETETAIRAEIKGDRECDSFRDLKRNRTVFIDID